MDHFTPYLLVSPTPGYSANPAAPERRCQTEHAPSSMMMRTAMGGSIKSRVATLSWALQFRAQERMMPSLSWSNRAAGSSVGSLFNMWNELLSEDPILFRQATTTQTGMTFVSVATLWKSMRGTAAQPSRRTLMTMRNWRR